MLPIRRDIEASLVGLGPRHGARREVELQAAGQRVRGVDVGGGREVQPISYVIDIHR